MLTDLYYCLDESPQIKLLETCNKTDEILTSEILHNLSDGNHSLSVHGETNWGNTVTSNVTFCVNSNMPVSDNTPPKATIIFPENETYFSVGFKIDLTFQTNKPLTWARFSLGNQANETIFGNTTINKFAPAGKHNMRVYFADYKGNIGASEIIHFTTIFLTEEGLPSPIAPVISIENPKNMTYTKNEVPLSFLLNEPISIDGSKPNYPDVSRIIYCLDGQNNITVTEDTVLKDLSNGQHSVIVYAEDVHGNTGASETIFFSVQSEIFPVLNVAALICGSAILAIAVFFYSRKTKSRRKGISGLMLMHAREKWYNSKKLR